jgi:hypothetical protein
LRRGTIETDSAYVGVGAAILIHRIAHTAFRSISDFGRHRVKTRVPRAGNELLDELHVSPRVIRRRPDRICAVSLQYKNKLRNSLMYLYSL